MKKPKPKKKEYFDYHECEKYIADKLGIKDLRNVAGKTYGYGKKKSDDYPYQDFWHLMCDTNDINNPCTITMPYLKDPLDLEGAEDGLEEWQEKIIQAFYDEFGEEAEYWVEW